MTTNASVPSSTQSAVPGSVTTAAVILLILGALAGAGTLLLLLGTPVRVESNSQATDYGLMGPLTVMVVGGLLTVGHLAAGIGILRRRGWGRTLGFVIAGLVLLLLLLGVLVTVAGMAGSRIGIFELAVVAVGIALYGFVIVVLASHGDAFA